MSVSSGDTISELKTQPESSRCVLVLGYDVPGDGGGGVFYWDPASSEDEDGGRIIQPATRAEGRWKRLPEAFVNVKWFGAKGDGVTNDTTAFQRASRMINSNGGGRIVIPPGIYIVGRQTLVGKYGQDKGSYPGEDILHIHDCP